MDKKTSACGWCGKDKPESELEHWGGDDVKLCPDCIKRYDPRECEGCGCTQQRDYMRYHSGALLCGECRDDWDREMDEDEWGR